MNQIIRDDAAARARHDTAPIHRDSGGQLVCAVDGHYIALRDPIAPTTGPYQPVGDVTALDVWTLVDGVPRWAGHAEQMEWDAPDDPAADPVPDAAYELHGRLTGAAAILRALLELDQQLDHDPTSTGNPELWAARNGLVVQLVRDAAGQPWPAGYQWDANGQDGYRWTAYVDLPTGQVSWHLPEDGGRVGWELDSYHARRYTRPWDGHSRADKAARIAAYLNTGGNT
jgi:hypothetical protein